MGKLNCDIAIPHLSHKREYGILGMPLSVFSSSSGLELAQERWVGQASFRQLFSASGMCAVARPFLRLRPPPSSLFFLFPRSLRLEERPVERGLMYGNVARDLDHPLDDEVS